MIKMNPILEFYKNISILNFDRAVLLSMKNCKFSFKNLKDWKIMKNGVLVITDGQLP